MFKKMLLIVCCAVLLVPAVSFSAWVDVGGGISIDPFHTAVRDFNGNGVYEINQGDHVRQGWNMRYTATGLPVPESALHDYFTVVNGPTNGILTGSETRYQVQGWTNVKGSYNHGDTGYTNEPYYRSRYKPNDPSTINRVDLYRNDNGVNTWIAQTPNVTLPNASQMRPYSGPDITQVGVEFNAATNNWDFSWTPVEEQVWDSTFRFTLNGIGGPEEIIRKFDFENFAGGVSISEDLFNTAAIESGTLMWAIEFQERFVNEGSGDNWNWLRSYGGPGCEFNWTTGQIIDTTAPVPLPASAWLLASGILGIIIKRRKSC